MLRFAATLTPNDTEIALPELPRRAEIAAVTDAPVVLSNAPQITTVECPDDLVHFLSEDDRVCVVKFHAKWCKVCARVNVKFRKFALELCDKTTKDGRVVEEGQVRFADVEVSANKELCQTLEVKKFPFFQVYRKREKIAAFGSGAPHNFKPVVERTVRDKLAMSDDEHDAFAKKFETEIAKGKAQLDELGGLEELGP